MNDLEIHSKILNKETEKFEKRHAEFEKAEEFLKWSEYLLMSVIESNMMGILIRDANDDITTTHNTFHKKEINYNRESINKNLAFKLNLKPKEVISNTNYNFFNIETGDSYRVYYYNIYLNK